jgi:hypothetical protein|tara:strand:+ start:118 stop:750 length:633 start_codon:yes stop_codon:yes gene_type:complete
MEDKPFNIVDYLPALTVDYSNNTTWEMSDPSPYVKQTLTGPDGFVYQSQIDIAGWTKEGLTAFFSNQYLQRDGPYIPSGAFTPTDVLQARDYIIITDVPLQVDSTIIHAGFMDNASDYMTIKFGQADIFLQTTTAPRVMIQGDAWRFGSGQPTASGTLYVTRICIPHMDVPSASNNVQFPAIRYIAQGVASAESEHVYLNRLRRSYELAQ